MKITSNLLQNNSNTIRPKSVSGSVPGLFKNTIEKFISNERAVTTAIPKFPAEFKGLMELQRSCSALQLQVECASRIADSVSSSIKKIQQLGGQG